MISTSPCPDRQTAHGLSVSQAPRMSNTNGAQAIGMGNNKMANCLYFMVYPDSTGSNITLSPRIAYDNVEPTYTQDITVEVSFGSGIANGVMTANGICRNCRSWNGGSIDPTNTKAPFIFAHGPSWGLKSNSMSADLKRHAAYGDFTMDLTKAVGSKALPNAAFADTAGTVQNSDKTDHDFGPPGHAVLMIGAFVFLMPLGIIILRIFKSAKWHAVNQGISVVVALLGGAVGIYIGTMYNRVRAQAPVLIRLTNNFAVKTIYFRSPNLRRHNLHSHDRSVRRRLLSPPNLHTDTKDHNPPYHSHMSGSRRNPLRHRQRIPWLPAGIEP